MRQAAAYMSTGADRVAAGQAERASGPAYEKMAEREVRAILADAEPIGTGAGYAYLYDGPDEFTELMAEVLAAVLPVLDALEAEARQ